MENYKEGQIQRKDKPKTLYYADRSSTKKIMTMLKTIFTYVMIFIFWQYIVSRQLHPIWYNVINIMTFAMIALACIAVVVSREEADKTVNELKKRLLEYFVIMWLYEVVIVVGIAGSLENTQTLGVDLFRKFVEIFSAISKIGIPFAFYIWLLNRISMFRSKLTSKEFFEKMRNSYKIKNN